MVTAGSVALADTGPGVIVRGNPATVIKKIHEGNLSAD
jgi:acetyltransferase-like isoleucine patch superfamily enzyme